jgi:hypothetical protein
MEDVFETTPVSPNSKGEQTSPPKRKDFGLIFWLHAFLILIYISLPFWVSWKIVFGVVLLMQAQFFFLGRCVMTKIEFNDSKNPSYFYYYVSKVFPNISYPILDFIAVYGYHLIIAITAFCLQYFGIIVPIL